MSDVLIVGAGPAGSAAACRARACGLDTVIVEKSAFPRTRACAGWISPAGVALLGECGVSPRKAGATVFDGLRLRSWELRKQTRVEGEGLSGWLVDRATFDAALLSAAVAAGARVLHGVNARQVVVGEDAVCVTLSDGAELAARLLFVADGCASATAQMVKLVPAGRTSDLPRALFLECAVPRGAAELEVVLGSGKGGRLATIVRVGAQLRVSMVTRDPAGGDEEQFAAFLKSAQAADIVPAGIDLTPHRAVMPAGVALDMDQHVGKRCLLIGDAGGFVGAFSNEGIYPAMKSGFVAADVAAKSLKAPLPQDALASFGGEWRMALAEYLRMPHTDLSLLAPLIFGNAQMAGRVARAFLLGQQF